MAEGTQGTPEVSHKSAKIIVRFKAQDSGPCVSNAGGTAVPSIGNWAELAAQLKKRREELAAQQSAVAASLPASSAGLHIHRSCSCPSTHSYHSQSSTGSHQVHEYR